MKGEIQSGQWELVRFGHLEWGMLEPEWHDCFRVDHLERVRRRLRTVGIEPAA
jgi:hypothetical protein